jgi:apolipoprotein N-acyltransferase
MRPTGESQQPLTGIQRLIDARPVWQIHAIAFAAGVIATLGFAPFYIVPAYVLGLTLLVWLLDGAVRRAAPMRASFSRAWSFAFGHFLSGMYWIWSAFAQVDGALVLVPVGVLALPAGLAVFWGLAGLIASRFWTRDGRRLAAFAAAFFCAELLRGHLFGGFPWNLAGYVWEAGGAISQAAAYVGIYGMTGLTLLACATPAALADRDHGWSLRAAPFLAAALGIGLVWGFGDQRLQAAGPLNGPHQGAVVRVVDPGFTQREKWTPGNELKILSQYLTLTEKEGANRSQIVVWAEGALPVRYPDMPYVLENPFALEAIGATLGDRVLVTGLHRVQRDASGTEAEFYNSAAVLDSSSGVIRIGQIHDKHRLTPFGEFIPLFNLIRWLDIPTLQAIGTGFAAGPPPSRVIVPEADPALILICYESIFPGLTPHGAERPSWLINVTNDAWFGDQTGPHQHFNQSKYRSIEEGLPMARAASGGISAIVDAYGRTLVSTGLDGGAVEAALPPTLSETIFARFGWLIVPLIALGLIVLRFAPPGAPRGVRS